MLTMTSIMLEVVRQNGWALAYAAAELHADRNIMLKAVWQQCQAPKHAVVELCADCNLMLEVVWRDGLCSQG